METELSHRVDPVNFTRKRKGSGEDETHPSRKMRCFPGDEIKDDELFLSHKIKSYPEDKTEEKPCPSLKIGSYPEDNIDDDEPCPSRKMGCHSRDRSKSRTDIHKVNEDFELKLSTIKSVSNSNYDNETKPSDENKTIQNKAELALNKDVTVPADSALTSCNIKSTISADVEEMVSEGNDKELPKKEAKIEEKTQQAEYVYRLLRPNELYKEGLRPKNIDSKASLHQHVAAGSKGVHSRFISCCFTLRALHRLARLTNQPSLLREVVRINVTKLNRDEVKVIELFIEDVRKKHLKVGSKAWGFVEKFDEVILEPKTHVPADCVERIGIVKDNVFTKDEHITL
ncbi:uncharacterized protein LOC128172274 [Crassostrea angulata]|uniref:uncharacterized protein LOC128172274 n=1 Tax=Magallana angulata TaxID=2784310 RepID=UPI0022B1A09F|nr:uncharacterized protein LOC128172274 [Crassostrea angulata]XP_052694027.1 uncharacterized protein LOC128172274 [Crassostrea angulata]XP_052694028.1 uncharacterized protein LOC128172274 [Crassostrea angulata]XP_052694029.1 uncharacterized protein LOC128172274 [Crassostrea angulata]XP_052694030.1 uncharacterized protein LOC128172274 [Crassostrea angulata]XP_052694031.1 uncharacterized protein LOC128172274 [Crassostrea angulata]